MTKIAKCVPRLLDRFASIIIAAAIAIRVFFYFLSENAGGDALARLQMTQEWLAHPYLKMDFNPWLPVHFWLIGAMAKLTGSVPTGGKLLSLLCGCAAVILFWKLVASLYSHTAALLSLIVFSLYTLQIGYSATSSSEATYLFFVVGGLAGVFVHVRTRTLLPALLGGLSLTIAAGIRYEAWIIIFACGLVVLLMLLFPERLRQPGSEGPNWPGLFILGFSAAVWPVMWLIYEKITMGHPLYFVSINHTWVAQQIAGSGASLTYRMAVSPIAILLTLTPVVVAGALWTAWSAVREITGRAFTIVVLFFAAVQVYQIVTGGVMTFARYTLTLGTLMAALSGPGLAWMGERLFKLRPKTTMISASILMAANLALIFAVSSCNCSLGDKFRSIAPRLLYPRRLQDMRDYLQGHVKPPDAIVLDDFADECNVLTVFSGYTLTTDPHVFCSAEVHEQQLNDFFARQRPRLLVYSDDGDLRPYLPLPSTCSDAALHGMKFHCVHENDRYRIYEISYDGQN